MLTERQRETVKWLAQGLSNKQIATQLGISEQTVKNHITGAMRACQVNNRVQLAIKFWYGHLKSEI